MPKILDRFQTSAPPLNCDINVTPLVDVCLVLLIIFMVITPMLQIGAAVQLPPTDKPTDIKRDEKQLLISIGNNLEVFLQSDRIAKSVDNQAEMQQFQIRMKDACSRNPDRKILVKADRRLTFGQVRTLMRQIQESGFTDIGIISDKAKHGV
jgi:biopolymer transport protein TolR